MVFPWLPYLRILTGVKEETKRVSMAFVLYIFIQQEKGVKIKEEERMREPIVISSL